MLKPCLMWSPRLVAVIMIIGWWLSAAARSVEGEAILDGEAVFGAGVELFLAIASTRHRRGGSLVWAYITSQILPPDILNSQGILRTRCLLATVVHSSAP